VFFSFFLGGGAETLMSFPTCLIGQGRTRMAVSEFEKECQIFLFRRPVCLVGGEVDEVD